MAQFIFSFLHAHHAPYSFFRTVFSVAVVHPANAGWCLWRRDKPLSSLTADRSRFALILDTPALRETLSVKSIFLVSPLSFFGADIRFHVEKMTAHQCGHFRKKATTPGSIRSGCCQADDSRTGLTRHPQQTLPKTAKQKLYAKLGEQRQQMRRILADAIPEKFDLHRFAGAIYQSAKIRRRPIRLGGFGFLHEDFVLCASSSFLDILLFCRHKSRYFNPLSGGYLQ